MARSAGDARRSIRKKFKLKQCRDSSSVDHTRNRGYDRGKSFVKYTCAASISIAEAPRRPECCTVIRHRPPGQRATGENNRQRAQFWTRLVWVLPHLRAGMPARVFYFICNFKYSHVIIQTKYTVNDFLTNIRKYQHRNLAAIPSIQAFRRERYANQPLLAGSRQETTKKRA